MNTDTTMQVTPVGTGGGFGGFGGDGAWWIIILFLFVFCGWGGNWGGNGGGGAQPNYTLVSDFAQVERKLDGIANGICDSTYALNNTIVNGFATGELSKANQQAALMQTLSNMQMQSADCCCKTQTAIGEVKYGASINTRDMMENQNANTRAILDAIAANRLEDKNAQIQAQQQKIFQLELAASQSNQNQYLINQIKPCPIPAYVTCNPWATSGYNGCNACGL